MNTSIKIVDESSGRRLSGTTIATLDNSFFNSLFKKYVTAISERVLAKTSKIALSQKDLTICPEVTLFFVYRPLVTPATSPFNLERSQSKDTRHLDSPWAKLTISKSPRLIVQGVFLWNERQFLLDQALMSDAQTTPTKDLMPIDDRTFGKFVQDYESSVLLAASPEAQSAAQASISKRLPPEILWLLIHSPQSNFAPFLMGVDHTFGVTLRLGVSGYTDLSKALVDQFLASTKTEICYESVLGLKDIFRLDQYKINQLY